MSVGLLSVAGSKILAALPLDRRLSPGIESFVADFVVEIIFEGGLALTGAALTAYFMEILLNKQQDRAKAFRKEFRRRLRDGQV